MKRVAVAMGGPSSEHDISLQSGTAVAINLKKAGFDVLPMWIDRDLTVRFCMPDQQCEEKFALWTAVDRLARDVDCVFIAMHGPFGEDGQFQAILTARGIPFSGSDHVGAAVATDKILSKRVYQSAGLVVPPFKVLDSELCLSEPETVAENLMKYPGLPMILKSPRLGSSFGIKLVKDRDFLVENLTEIAKLGTHVLVEAFISGLEFTVPVLDEPDGPTALPVIEIRVHSHDFFDYESKYDPNLADEVCPAQIPQPLAARISSMGILAHQALMLRGFSRSDFIVAPDGKIYILETNAIPGLTEVSLFPKAAAAAGISFPELVRRLCDDKMICQI